MAKLTQKQRHVLENIRYHLQRANIYLREDSVVVCRKCEVATTTLHLTRKDGLVLHPIDKEIGSDLTGLYQALQDLTYFLDEK
jgi:hypothetical protein